LPSPKLPVPFHGPGDGNSIEFTWAESRPSLVTFRWGGNEGFRHAKPDIKAASGYFAV